MLETRYNYYIESKTHKGNEMFYAYNYSHSNVSVIGFGITEEAAIKAAQKVCDFVKFVAKPSAAFFDTENGLCVFPEAKGFPPAKIGFSDYEAITKSLIELADAYKIGSAGAFARDHRGE